MKNWFTNARTFLAETRTELKKVSFPNREEVIGTTVVVIVTSIIFAIYLGVVDGIVQFLYRGLNTLLGV